MTNAKNKVTDNSIVLTHNDLNRISFPGFTQREIDFLYGVIINLYGMGGEKVRIDLNSLLEAVGMNYMDRSEVGFLNWFLNFRDKSASIICPMYMIDPDGSENFTAASFFGAVSVNIDSGYIEFQINPIFSYLVDKQKTHYTAFQFGELRSLKNKYPKRLFRHLSQWKTQGTMTFSIDELQRQLDYPINYRPSKIRQSVLDPSVNDLQELFPDLQCENIYKKRKVVGYKFTWDSEYFKDKKAKEIANKQENRAKRKDVTPENKSIDELQDELQRMWEEKGLER